MELCLLNIDQHDIGVPMEAVREVLIRPGISPLPLSPEFLVGVTGFRGMSLPVLELIPLLGLESTTSESRKNAGARDRVVVCQSSQGVLGIRVDLLDRLEHQEAGNTSLPESGLLHPLTNQEGASMNILNLSELFNQAQGLMNPHLEHAS
ncbi:MAG: chemotaxis protein CheW [Verrucomicrobiota bacterium]